MIMGGESMKLYRLCPCCNSAEGDKLFDIGFETSNYLPSQYNIVACTNCGFTFADLNASQSDYNEYYIGFNNYSDDMDLKVGRNLVGTLYESIFLGIKDSILLSDNIIDLGCGGGQLLSIFKNNGYLNLCGLDPSDNAILSLKKRGINGIVGNIFDKVSNIEKNKYDVVLSTSVIEHVYDLHNYVEQVKAYLRDDKSKIVLMLPAVEGFRDIYFARAHYFNQEHINYFSIESLDNLMCTHGLKRINDNTYFDHDGEKLILAVYAKDEMKKPVKRETASKASILSYLEKDNIKNRELNNKLDAIEGLSSNIIVFGVGQLISQILYERPSIINKIDYFIDNNPEKQKRDYMGKKVCPANKILKTENPIVICSIRNSEDIEKQISVLGCKNQVIKL